MKTKLIIFIALILLGINFSASAIISGRNNFDNNEIKLSSFVLDISESDLVLENWMTNSSLREQELPNLESWMINPLSFSSMVNYHSVIVENWMMQPWMPSLVSEDPEMVYENWMTNF